MSADLRLAIAHCWLLGWSERRIATHFNVSRYAVARCRPTPQQRVASR